MNCIQEIICGTRTIIGVRDYPGCVTPESGLFINDLPGMSLRRAAQVANEEYISGADLLRKKTILGAQMVLNDFTEYLGDLFDFNAVVETKRVLRFDETSPALPAANAERGLVAKRWRSEIGRLYVEEVYVRATTSGVATVKIYDGDAVTEYLVDVLPDQTITVRTDYTAKAEQVRVVFNQTSFPVYTCTINENSAGCGSCYSQSNGHQGLYITGWDGTKEINKCYGLGMLVSVRCFEEHVLCSVLPRMWFLMWYKGGIEFIKEQQNSTRMSPIVMFDQDRAKALREEWEKEYAINYNRLKKNILRHLMSLKADCITCKADHYEQRHP